MLGSQSERKMLREDDPWEDTPWENAEEFHEAKQKHLPPGKRDQPEAR